MDGVKAKNAGTGDKRAGTERGNGHSHGFNAVEAFINNELMADWGKDQRRTAGEACQQATGRRGRAGKSDRN